MSDLGSGKTNAWFGDYVSEYNFSQSMDDGATVPLFYRKRVPTVLNQNEDLSEEFYEILEDENLDEAQRRSRDDVRRRAAAAGIGGTNATGGMGVSSVPLLNQLGK